eukprot:scaffold8198_cov287-Chaetoceros_neogracile.AAC.5
MKALKKRIGSRGGTNILSSSNPFFSVDVQLLPPKGIRNTVANYLGTFTNVRKRLNSDKDQFYSLEHCQLIQSI